MNRLVQPHYETALTEALNAPADEICEMYLNQARGMAEYGFLSREISSAQFELQIQRQNGIRTQRSARRNATGVAA